MVFKLISIFQAKRVTQCLVSNGFYTNFSILSITSVKNVWFRMNFTLISVFEARCVTQCWVYSGFYTNFMILSITSDKMFGLEWLLP